MKISYRQILPIYYRIWKIWREKRFAAFKRIIAPDRIDHLLDVGGVTGATGMAGWIRCNGSLPSI
jgi:hypothetical protein